MTMEKRLSANRNLFDEYSEFHDLLTDTLSAFEDLYYEMETALEDISDSLEDARHRLDDIDTAFRRIQCRNRLRERKRMHIYSPPEPSESFAPLYPPEIYDMDDELFLPFPGTDGTE
jgi:hypothetical protein